MTTIIAFPLTTSGAGKPLPKPLIARVGSMMVRITWVLSVAVWPILRWVLALDVTVQLFRMLMLFADRGVYVDWTFIAHFVVVIAFFCFVACYRS